MNTHKRHDEHTRLIALHPHKFGIDGVVLSMGESNIFEEKKIISQPDNLMFDPTTNTLYNIEYKCNNNKSQGNHAKS